MQSPLTIEKNGPPSQSLDSCYFAQSGSHPPSTGSVSAFCSDIDSSNSPESTYLVGFLELFEPMLCFFHAFTQFSFLSLAFPCLLFASV